MSDEVIMVAKVGGAAALALGYRLKFIPRSWWPRGVSFLGSMGVGCLVSGAAVQPGTGQLTHMLVVAASAVFGLAIVNNGTQQTLEWMDAFRRRVTGSRDAEHQPGGKRHHLCRLDVGRPNRTGGTLILSLVNFAAFGNMFRHWHAVARVSQVATPSMCSSTCSIGLARRRESWLTMPTSSSSQALPASAPRILLPSHTDGEGVNYQ